MVEIQRRWYSTYSHSEFQIDLRRKLAATQVPSVIDAYAMGRVTDFEQRALLYIAGTRRERWAWLCEDLKVDGSPEAFVAYRGDTSPENAVALVKAWFADDDEMLVSHKGLSSWSLLEGDARTGARTHFMDRSVGSFLVAEIPIEKTFLDVFVDDAYFARHGVREAEIVVGTGDPDLEIPARTKRCKMQAMGREFGDADREFARETLKVHGHWSD